MDFAVTNMTFPIHSTNAVERIESLKAGLTGATATLPVLTLMLFVEQRLTALHPGSSDAAAFNFVVPDFLPAWLVLLDPAMGLKSAIVLFSGFLFGATYRYVVRQDANPHLKAGAVMAFGLVRGLAQVEVTASQVAPLLLSLRVGESLLLFWLVAMILDWFIQQGWVKAFPSGGDR